MAKLEKEIEGNFEEILKKIEDGIMKGSITATLEDSSDFVSDKAKCSVRVFERYSSLGSNRVSLSITLFQNNEEKNHLTAITSGGSQALFWKINTIGEKAFLNKLKEIL